MGPQRIREHRAVADLVLFWVSVLVRTAHSHGQHIANQFPASSKARPHASGTCITQSRFVAASCLRGRRQSVRYALPNPRRFSDLRLSWPISPETKPRWLIIMPNSEPIIERRTIIYTFLFDYREGIIISLRAVLVRKCKSQGLIAFSGSQHFGATLLSDRSLRLVINGHSLFSFRKWLSL